MQCRSGRGALTGVPHRAADGVAAGEEQLDDPGGDVPGRAGHAHHLPRRGAHCRSLERLAAFGGWRWRGCRAATVRMRVGAGFREGLGGGGVSELATVRGLADWKRQRRRSVQRCQGTSVSAGVTTDIHHPGHGLDASSSLRNKLFTN